MIPKIIHLIRKEQTVPEHYKAYYDRMVSLHPAWTIHSYDDEDMLQWVARHYPGLLEPYTRFPHAIQRSDLFRMLVVHWQGGFYLDMDMYCLQPLDTLLHHVLVLGEEKTLKPSEMSEPHHRHDLRIANYMFGGIAGYPFLFDFVQAALQYSEKPVTTTNDILETTGPGHFTNFYHEKQPAYPDIHLLRNTGLTCIKKCTLQPSCHFGSYAAHLHLGSWRWQ